MTNAKDCHSMIGCYSKRLPICASDGKNYHNECAMRRHACDEKKAKIGVMPFVKDCGRY